MRTPPRLRPSVLLLLAGFVAASAAAQTTPPPAPPPPPPEARQFDFWVGDWDVFLPNGTKAGENRIEPIAGGWGLAEHWRDAAGGTGRSLNSYNRARKQWQQFWVGQGGILELAGGLEDGSMVLRGESRGRDGQAVQNRITWTPQPDGSVRQHWEQSADGGATWNTIFDGRYRKKS